MSVEGFAQLIGQSKSSVSRMENGKYVPSDPVLTTIASRCCIKERWLRTGEGPMEDGDFFKHTDERLVELVGFLEEWWNTHNAAQRFGLSTALKMALPEMQDWLHERRPPFTREDLDRDPSLRALLTSMAGKSAEALEQLPDIRDAMLLTLSDLIQVQWPDVRAFLVEWWDSHDEDERAWLRVQIRRTVPRLDESRPISAMSDPSARLPRGGQHVARPGQIPPQAPSHAPQDKPDAGRDPQDR